MEICREPHWRNAIGRLCLSLGNDHSWIGDDHFWRVVIRQKQQHGDCPFRLWHHRVHVESNSPPKLGPRARAGQRIVMHLTLMLGGTVAAWTALTVTQVTFDPPWVPWLAPTAIFLPLIVLLRRKEKRKLADDRSL